MVESVGTKGDRSRVMASSTSIVAAASTEMVDVKMPWVPLVTGSVTAASPHVVPTVKLFVTEDPPFSPRLTLAVVALPLADLSHTLKLRAVVVGVAVSSRLSEPEDLAVMRRDPWPLCARVESSDATRPTDPLIAHGSTSVSPSRETVT